MATPETSQDFAERLFRTHQGKRLREQLSKSLVLASLENLMKYDNDVRLRVQVSRRYIELLEENNG